MLTLEDSEINKHSPCYPEASVFQVEREENNMVVVHMWFILMEAYDLSAVGVQYRFCHIWAVFKDQMVVVLS